MKHYAALSLLMVFLLFSCQEEDISKDSTISNVGESDSRSTEDELALVNQSMEVLAQFSLNLSKSKSARSNVYKLVESQFDGDYNVLFKDVLNSNSIGHSTRTGPQDGVSVIATENINEALDSFLGIEDSMNLYPQIYIPFYEELTASGKLGTEDLTIVIHLSDNSKSTFMGLQGDNNTNLVATDFLIDEEFAKNNEVWVLSINERVDNDGNVKKEYREHFDIKAAYREHDKNGRAQDIVDAFGRTMRISCMKESWASGELEIEIMAVSTWFGSVNPATSEVGSYYYIGFLNLAPGGWKRKWVNNNSTRSIPFPLYNADTDDYGDYYCYTIYEHDPWPTGLRERPVGPPGTSSQYILRFRSADNEYIWDFIDLLNEICTYDATAGTGCINWTTQCI